MSNDKDFKADIFSKTAAEWTAANPYLARNDLGVETDTGKLKVGVGQKWSDTEYLPMSSGGDPGAAGASAYEVAVAEGFTGDEAAWLASLVGPPGDTYDQSLNTTDAVTFVGVSLSNGTQVIVGSYDDGLGGLGGISLVCAVGYEFNWQSGRLRSVQVGGDGTPQPIHCDSQMVFDGGVDGLTFADSDNAPVTLTQFTADVNDLDLDGGGIVRIASDAARSITGIVAGVAGDARLLVNVGDHAITLKHQDAGSAAANRIICVGAADVEIPSQGSMVVHYDGTDERWRAG